MAVLRITRFTIDPADEAEMRARRTTLLAKVHEAFPNRLTGTQLVKVDDETWFDAWRWASRDAYAEVIAVAPTLPEAGNAFAITKDPSLELGDIIEES
ncbi:hypothetical protein KGQ20_20100 [Catenulispora sp. NF23]|uniref:ABM domain-containing protein n=1 Tax=Catenulispora pinistramenti TaxID=2705254 RepID=A0ABS5KT31_9ACTN|nr:hypothetical protein [Catenulispora pinistramenti]MBS2535073.1 hypothetical protein [Catenulispora pinistramenti]MBS2549211.1 hypothetical protein [Catenulispora pinistramenti]